VADPAGASLATVGVSSTPVCGVRDHGRLLSDELARRGAQVSWHWLERQSSSLPGARREFRDWTARLPQALREEGAAAVLLHYSVFSYSHRGVPLFVHAVADSLRRACLPVVMIVHEAAYPWSLGGARGKLWAATQRLALIDVVRASAAMLLTADFRARWLASRRWLPRRALAVAPVFSNLPPPTAAPAAAHAGQPEIGVFGYAYEGTDAGLVLDALALLAREGSPAVLRLLGAPGADSSAGADWLAAARARGLSERLSFSGTLAPQQLSDGLARCAALLCIAAAGPSSRKGSLAGSLASGSPVVALDGPLRWQRLVDEQALVLTERSAPELARALARLLADREQAAAQGARGRRFAEQHMGVAGTAEALLALLGELAR
jgi:glycosyltransferase involved in cell wall biosynthesis